MSFSNCICTSESGYGKRDRRNLRPMKTTNAVQHPTVGELKRLLANVDDSMRVFTLREWEPVTEEADHVTTLRMKMEELGSWGIVSWGDEDIARVLVDPSPENIALVRQEYGVRKVADCMIEAGWEWIEGSIRSAGLEQKTEEQLEAKEESEEEGGMHE